MISNLSRGENEKFTMENKDRFIISGAIICDVIDVQHNREVDYAKGVLSAY